MKVPIGSKTYHVRFRNKSEKVTHDPTPQRVVEVLKDPSLRRYLRLRRPTHISTITTECDIVDASAPDTVIASGQSFYSRTENPFTHPFDQLRARVLSLQRALGQNISHRCGDIFSQQERDEFWKAFQAFVAKRTAIRKHATTRLTSSVSH